MTAYSYTRRIIDDELDELMPDLAAIAVEGAKGVGKTVTCQQRATTHVALDDDRVAEIVRSDLDRIRRAAPPVLLDEWQRLPQVWDYVRRRVDDHAPPGSYLLTGSALPAGIQVHSGAGRIVGLTMRPLSLAERELDEPTVSLGDLLAGKRPAIRGETTVALTDYAGEIAGSGFPGIRPLSPRAQRNQLDSYINRIVDRDLSDVGLTIRRPASLRRWLAAYAAATATTANYNVILDAATSGDGDKPAKTTTIAYRDYLARLYLIDEVEGWIPSHNLLARATQAPKHHLVDPALAARLLGLDAAGLISFDGPARGGRELGNLFESLITMSMHTYAQLSEARVLHFRTKSGDREVDLIVERADHRVVAIEVKLSATVSDEDVKHLIWLKNKLGDTLVDAIVITTGPYAYRRQDGIGVVPAALLGP